MRRMILASLLLGGCVAAAPVAPEPSPAGSVFVARADPIDRYREALVADLARCSRAVYAADSEASKRWWQAEWQGALNRLKAYDAANPKPN